VNRRKFISVVASALFAARNTAKAQQPATIPRVGVLVPAEPESPNEPNVAGFRQALRDLGYVEKQNIAVEYRYAHGKAELYPLLAAELVRLKVDVLVVGSSAPALAAKNATQTIPIVFVGPGDPVGNGLVASLARPGGNLTGLTTLIGGGFFEKWVELLREAAPKISRVGYLRDAHNPSSAMFVNDLLTVTQALGLKLDVLEVHELCELDSMLVGRATLFSSPKPDHTTRGET